MDLEHITGVIANTLDWIDSEVDESTEGAEDVLQELQELLEALQDEELAGARTLTSYAWMDLTAGVEQQFGINLYDCAEHYKIYPPHAEDYPVVAWAKRHGLRWEVLNGDVSGEDREERIRINTEYRSAPDGMAAEPPMLDFVSWVHTYAWGDEIHNGMYVPFNPRGLKEDQEINEAPDWAIPTLDKFIIYFEERGMPDEITVHVWW